MTELVPYQTEPTSLAQVEDICAQVELWAEATDDVAALRDNSHKLAAITVYLARTSKEGQARVFATLRRLDVRVGQLLTKDQGRRNDLVELVDRDQQVGIEKSSRAHLRRMAAHPEVVEEVIEQSTDQNPATRRSVLRAIDAKIKTQTQYANKDTSDAANAWRRQRVAELAAQGVIVPQIAEELGIRHDTVLDIARDHGIEVKTKAAPAGAKYAGGDKTQAAVAWRREQLAAMAAEGLFSTEVARKLDITERTALKIAQDLGIEFRANRLMQRRKVRIDLDEYLLTMTEGLANSIDRAFDMLDGVWDQLDPEVRVKAEITLAEMQPRLTRLRKTLRGDALPPPKESHGLGAARWVTVNDDTWRDFRVATELAGHSPGVVLGQAVEQYIKEHKS